VEDSLHLDEVGLGRRVISRLAWGAVAGGASSLVKLVAPSGSIEATVRGRRKALAFALAASITACVAEIGGERVIELLTLQRLVPFPHFVKQPIINNNSGSIPPAPKFPKGGTSVYALWLRNFPTQKAFRTLSMRR
jgi:hypothetical protein